MLISITLAAISATVFLSPSVGNAPQVTPKSAEQGAASESSAKSVRVLDPNALVKTRWVSKGEEVHFRTRDKLRLGGSYYGPKSKKGLAPAALLIHDAGCSREEMEGLALHLQKRGFGVLSIDLRGHGDSVCGEANWSTIDNEKARKSLWSFAANDLKAAAAWLRDRPEIHSSNLSVVGVGASCSLAVRHALDD